jgi:flagella basal body P-ring formation protein FlgA
MAFAASGKKFATLGRTPVPDRNLVIARELKYPLTTDEPFSLDSLTKPLLIQREDLVQLVAEPNNLRIRQQNEALRDGALGKVINVRNNSSEMIIRPRPMAPIRKKFNNNRGLN